MTGRRTGFTTRASCLLAAGLTAILCGLLLGEVDLVRAGILAAAIPCAAALVVQRSRVRIGNRRSIEPTRVSAGEAVSIHLVISNKSVLRTGTLMVEDQLPERLVGHARFVLDPLGSHESRTVSYRIPGLGRGRYRVGPLRIRLTDPFRMIDLSRSFTATNEFVVGPVVDQLPAVEPPRSDELGDNAGSHSIGAYGADDQSTREYRTGDDLRKIHWRSSARTGALMVRQEERPWRGQSTLLLDLRAAGHATAVEHPVSGVDPRQTSSLEWAVSAAASIGNHVLMRGRELSMLADPSGDHRRFAGPRPAQPPSRLGARARLPRSELDGGADPQRRPGVNAHRRSGPAGPGDPAHPGRCASARAVLAGVRPRARRRHLARPRSRRPGASRGGRQRVGPAQCGLAGHRRAARRHHAGGLAGAARRVRQFGTGRGRCCDDRHRCARTPSAQARPAPRSAPVPAPGAPCSPCSARPSA